MRYFRNSMKARIRFFNGKKTMVDIRTFPDAAICTAFTKSGERISCLENKPCAPAKANR